VDRLTLPDSSIEAGQEYLDSVRRLGLEPEGFLWAYDKTIEQYVLVMVTSQFDTVGPQEIYRLLTKAYRASATPREINPFIIRLHSVNQLIVPHLQRAVELDITSSVKKADGSVSEATYIDILKNALDLSFRKEWIYVFRIKRVKPADRSRRWKRFAQNVERLAA
jgi:hypothetical protein